MNCKYGRYRDSNGRLIGKLCSNGLGCKSQGWLWGQQVLPGTRWRMEQRQRQRDDLLHLHLQLLSHVRILKCQTSCLSQIKSMIHFRGNFLERLGTPYESGVPCSGCPNDCESVAVGGGAQYDYIATNQISGIRFNVSLFMSSHFVRRKSGSKKGYKLFISTRT